MWCVKVVFVLIVSVAVMWDIHVGNVQLSVCWLEMKGLILLLGVLWGR